MAGEVSSKKIRKELAKRIEDSSVIDRIVYMFWDLDAYQSIISNKKFFEILLKYIDTQSTNFTRYEIYEYFISEISPDGLADLKKIATSLELLQQNDLDVDEMGELFANLSITKKDQIDKIFNSEITNISQNKRFSFVHHTIQEYLASKFILESSDTLSKFEEYILFRSDGLTAIKPSWYGVIRFLAESEKGNDILARIIEIIKEYPDNVDENFSDSICSLTYGTINDVNSNALFEAITSVYKKKAIWLPIWASKNIWRLVTQDNLPELKRDLEVNISTVKEAVVIGNSIAIIEGIIKNRYEWIEADIEFYQTKLIEFAHEEKGYGVVQRRSFDALEYAVGNEEVLKSVANIIDSEDQLVRESLLDLASKILPNSERTIDLLVEGFKKDNAIHSRHGLYEITSEDGILYFLQKLVEDADLRYEFLDQESIFSAKDRKGDEKLIKLIKELKGSERIIKVLKELIIDSYGFHDTYYSHRGSPFLTEITKIISSVDPNFGLELASKIKGGKDLYDYIAPFVQLLSLTNFDELVKELLKIAKDKDWIVRNILYATKGRGDDEGKKIFEKALKEGLVEKTQGQNVDKLPSKYEELKKQLEPVKGKFNPNVFRYFCDNYEDLKEEITDKEKERLKELIIGTVLEKWDPKTIEVTIESKDSKAGTKSYTITSWAPIYGDALRAALLIDLKEEIQKYRESIINYIPFAYSQEEDAIKEILSSVSDSEIKYVNKVFLNKGKDTRYYSPSTYTYLIPQLLDKDSGSSSKEVYLSFIEDPKLDGYVRVQAIEKLERCLSERDEEYLLKLFKKYLSSSDEKEVEIAEKANEFLISRFTNKAAIKWRFEQIKERMEPFIEPLDFHEVSSYEDELHEKKFARVLTELDEKYIPNFIELLQLSLDLIEEKKDYKSYSNYLRNLSQIYFTKMVDKGIYVVDVLEDWLDKNSSNKNSNWYERMVEEIRIYSVDSNGKANLSDIRI
jgi:hypothetical protein